MKFRVFWNVLPRSQIDVDIDLRTRQYIPEDSELHNSFVVYFKGHSKYLGYLALRTNVHSLRGIRTYAREIKLESPVLAGNSISHRGTMVMRQIDIIVTLNLTIKPCLGGKCHENSL
jgi:hypothetical protein